MNFASLTSRGFRKSFITFFLIICLNSCTYEQVKVYVEYVSHEPSKFVGIYIQTCTWMKAVGCNGNFNRDVRGEGFFEKTFSSRKIYFLIDGKVDVAVTLSINGNICAKETIVHISEKQTESVVECKPTP